MAFYKRFKIILSVYAIWLTLFTIYSLIYLFIVQKKNNKIHNKTHQIIYIIVQSVYIFISIILSIFTIWTIVSNLFLKRDSLIITYQVLSRRLTQTQLIYIIASTVFIQFFIQLIVVSYNIRIFLKKLNALDNPQFMRKLDLAVLGINSITLVVIFIILFTKKRII